MSLRILILLGFVFATEVVRAQTPPVQTAIENVLNAQVEAWNRGDTPTFISSYTDDCIFVGKERLQGRAKLLDRYRKSYPSPEAMGKLTFQNLRVRQLDREIAIATGEWHIDRPAASGGSAGGVFSLVLQKRGGTWQIVLDHTT